MEKVYLNGEWEWRIADGDSWYIGTVPGSVINDSLENKLIADPYYRTNEYKAYDLFENDYEYIKTFALTEHDILADKINLVCEGLDTLAEIRINGSFLEKTDNMHRKWVLDCKEYLQAGDNHIVIKFLSPNKFIWEKFTSGDISYAPTGCRSGNNYLRKGHFMFGWDWGPSLADAGIFRDIYFEFYNEKINDVYMSQNHTEDGTVIVGFSVSLDGMVLEKGLNLNISLTSPDQTEVLTKNLRVTESKVKTAIEVENPLLWWPKGYGEQPLYKVDIALNGEHGRIDEYKAFIGLRQITVRQNADKWGREFAITVNGTAIFAMGANYIPEDNILSRVTYKRTEELIKRCAEANFNCIRVWGGGYYPDDYFYDICDRYGMVVWQDFMFACNIYALSEGFEESVYKEAADNIRRIRHHACLGLWCGNNEMEVGWECWGGVVSHHPKYKADYIKIFEYIIPKALKEYDPDRFYHPSSPSSGGSFDNPNDENRGDVHYWDVWHGSKPFEEYRKFYFRFCSEFGFQSFPSIKTVKTFTMPEDRNIFTEVMESHQKNGTANGQILYYISQNYLYPKDFDSLLYISQVLQARAIKYGVEHWRRHRGRCMGALFWQLNDCWPVASWACIDYYGRLKALYYEAKRFFAAKAVTALDEGSKITYFAHNESMEAYEGFLSVALRDNDFNIIYESKTEIKVNALSVKEVITVDYSEYLNERNKNNVFASYALVVGNETVSSGTNIFVVPKHYNYIKPRYITELTQTGKRFLLNIKTDVYACFVEVQFTEADIVLSDNFFDISTPDGVTVYFECESITVDELKEQINLRSIADSF